MSKHSSINASENPSIETNFLTRQFKLASIFSVFKDAKSINDTDLDCFVKENINPKNYYIFIYFYQQFKTENYIDMIKSILKDKLKIDNIDFENITQELFELKYDSYIKLNSLSQAIDINFDEFVKVFLNKEKMVPSSIIPLLLDKEWVDIIKIMMDLQVHIYEIESINAFEIGRTSFLDLYFQPLDLIDDNVKVKKKSILLPKHIVYYLYKSNVINKEKREYLIKQLAQSINFDEEHILLLILRMKDQCLAEYLIGNEIVKISPKNVVASLVCSLKFNCPRVSFLIFQLIQRDIQHLQDEKFHRALVRAIIDYPENIEIFIFIVYKIVKYIDVSNLKYIIHLRRYLLSILQQLLFFKQIEDCKFLRIVNGLKTCVLIIELIEEISNSAQHLIVVCQELKNEFMCFARNIIVETKDKATLSHLYTDTDLRNRETIYIISNNNYIDLLDNPASEELVNKLWVGQTSTQGRFYFTSTQYDIIVNANNSKNLSSIMNKITNRKSKDLNSFYESFFIWKNSIFVKFYSQTLIYIFILIFFQLFYNIVLYFLMNVFYSFSLAKDILINSKDIFNQIDQSNYSIDQIFNISINRNLTIYYTNISNVMMNSNGSYNNSTLIALIPILVANLTNVISNYSLSNTSLTNQLKSNTYSITYLCYVFLLPLINIIFKKIYILKTGKTISLLNIQYILDILLFIVVFLRIFFIDQDFLGLFNKLGNFNDFNEMTYINYTFYVVAMILIIWIKLIQYLKFSEKLGPLIRIIEQIFIEISYFVLLLAVEIIIFGCLANVLFCLDQSTQSYRSVQSSIMVMYSLVLNQVDFTFDSDSTYFGPLFLIIHIFLAYMILLNMLVAILSMIYVDLIERSKILFQQEIINRKDEYIVDPRYGGMINLSFPLNILNIIFCPIYLMITDIHKLKYFNNIVNFIAYFPLFLVMSCIHFSSQLMLIPITLIKIIIILVFEIIYPDSNVSMYYKINKNLQPTSKTFSCIKKVVYCLFLIILSPFWIIFSIIYDYTFYVKCLMKENNNSMLVDENSDDIFVSPLIINKIGEVFASKPKNSELLMEEIIDEYVDHLSFYNSKFDFKNFLLLTENYPVENLSLIREFSNFVKFINKLKVFNDFQEKVIIRSLVVKLIESNNNFIKIKTNFVEKISVLDHNILSILQNDVMNENYLSKMDQQNLIENEFDNGYLSTILDDKDKHTLKYQFLKKSLMKFIILPKLFYKRLSMINMQDIYNALISVKSSEDIMKSSLKIRKDIKIIKKNVGEVVDVLNAKEVLKIRKTKENRNEFIKRRSSTISSLGIGKFHSDNQMKKDFSTNLINQKFKNSNKMKINLKKINNILDEKDE